MPQDIHTVSRTRTQTLFDEEQQYIAPGLQTIALLSELAISHGRGATLTDLDGNTYLDLNAGVSVASLGHAHPRYVAAISEQVKAVTVGSFTSPARAELVRLIADIAPGNLRRVQFFSGGAEAVEAAIRLARSYTKRTDIVGFTGAFHGKTAGVLPLSDVDWKHQIGPLPPGFHAAPYPDPTLFAGTAEECAAASIAALKALIAGMATKPAAIIMEPVQGTAGNIVPPDGFLASVRDVARECGALLIADEMITGFARTGLMFGSNYDAVAPDIMTLGKGMAGGFPMSAVLSTDEIVSAKPFSLPSASSSSYGGNPLAAAAGLVTVKTILEDGLVDNSARVGRVLLDGFRAMAAHHPVMANVRGRGLLIGFDLVERAADGRVAKLMAKDRCIALFKDLLAHGLIAMCYSPRVRIHPPLILSVEQAKSGLATIDAALTRLESGRA